MQPAPNDSATWVRLPIDRTRLSAGNHDLDVFELDQSDKTTTPQPDPFQIPGSGRQSDLVSNNSSNQDGSEELPSTTKTYMKRTKPWLNHTPQNFTYFPAFVDQLISLFFSHHVLTTDVYTTCLPGYLEELPSMYHSASIDSALVESVKAASLMGALSRNELKAGSYFYATALRSYSQALRKLRIDLHEPETATNDATMMTIIMLDQMETYYYPDRSLPLGPHFTGLVHVMQARGNDQLFSKRGWSLFRIAHHRLLNRQLMTFQKPLPQSYTWMRLINKGLPNTKNASLILEVIDAVATTRSLLNVGITTTISCHLTSLLSSITRLDNISRQLTDWIRTLPGEWKYTSESLSPELSASILWLPISRIHLYRNTWVACQWQWHHGAHIMLLETLRCALSCMQSFQSEPDLSITRSRISQCTNTIIRLAYDILAAIPQLLGIVDAAGELIVSGSENVCVKQIGGYFAMFAMDVVKDVPSTMGQQKQAAAETLRRIRGLAVESRQGPGPRSG